MNILLVNDDGAEARGIRELAEELSQVSTVYVCAPDRQQSGKSHSITIRDHVFVQEISFPHADAALQTTGTPADCAKIGLQFFKDRGVKMDMVFSGINLGSNLGVDTLYSGTVGAAMEAAVSGYPAAAVSVSGHEPQNFQAARTFARRALSLKDEIPRDSLLNINVPDLPEEEIRGMKITRLGHRNFQDGFRLQDDGGYQLKGSPQDFTRDDLAIDLAAVAQGYASVTPVTFDSTHWEWLKKLRTERFDDQASQKMGK